MSNVKDFRFLLYKVEQEDVIVKAFIQNEKKSVIFGGVVGAPALFVPLFATSFLVVCYDNICA